VDAWRPTSWSPNERTAQLLLDNDDQTKRISAFPVGFLSGLPVSSPVLDKDGKFIRMLDGWIGGRKYPMDMAAFAVSIKHFVEV